RGAGKAVDPPSEEGADDHRRHELAQDAEREAHRVPHRSWGGTGAVLPQAACARGLARIALLRVERVGQLVEPRPQTFAFALAAFIFAPFVLLSLIFVLLLAALRHPSCSSACLSRS